MNLVALILFAFVFSINGAPNARIVNGSLATLGEFPYVASLYYSGSLVCGGFIYNSRWIITAASCFDGRSNETFSVGVGQVSLIEVEPNEQILQVLNIVINENYDEFNKFNDIALVQVKHEIVFSQDVDFITYDEINPTTPNAVVMGWGAVVDGGLAFTRLIKTNVTIGADCSIFGADQYDMNLMICASSETSTPCNYDEGSPLVQNGKAKGIFSKHLGCSPPYVPGIYTRLAPFYSFIRANAGVQPTQPTITTMETFMTTLEFED